MGNWLCTPAEMITNNTTSLIEPTLEEKELDRLDDVSSKLKTYIKGLEQDANNYREEARSHVKNGHTNLAKSALRMRKAYLDHAERHSQALVNIEAIKLAMGSSVAVRDVVGAMKIGEETLKRVNESVGDVDGLMAKVQEGMDQAATIMTAVGDSTQIIEAANGGMPFDEDELEKELAELERESIAETHTATVTQRLSRMPVPPTTPAPIVAPTTTPQPPKAPEAPREKVKLSA